VVKKAEIEVIPFHGMTQLKIDKIMEDSFENAIDDFNERQLIEFRQSAERIFKGIEQNWEMAKNFLEIIEIKEIEAQIEKVRQIMQGNDAQALKSELDRLGDFTRPIADTVMGRFILEELKTGSKKKG
jgi:Hsp70 protein.